MKRKFVGESRINIKFLVLGIIVLAGSYCFIPPRFCVGEEILNAQILYNSKESEEGQRLQERIQNFYKRFDEEQKLLEEEKQEVRQKNRFLFVLVDLINDYYYFPLFLLLVLFVYLCLWWKKEKQPYLHGPIVAEYAPPEDLRPLEMAGLLNQDIKLRDISITVFDLATRGYIEVKEAEDEFGKKDYKLLSVKDFRNEPSLRKFEKNILNFIFFFGKRKEVSVSFLKTDFHKFISLIHADISEALVQKRFFIKRIDQVKKRIAGIGFLFLLFGLVNFAVALKYTMEEGRVLGKLFYYRSFSLYLYNYQDISLISEDNLPIFACLAGISSVIVGIATIIFAHSFSKRTLKGARVCRKVLGFKQYLETAEKHRLEFAGEEGRFERFLPYAMMFGIINKWADTFEGLYRKIPSWLESDVDLGFYS